MIIRQLSVFLENKKGRLCAAAEVLAKNGVNIRALSLADTTEFGILRLIVDRPDVGRDALTAAGIVVRVTDVLAVTVSDEPGGMYNVLHALEEGGVAIEYMYACVGKAHGKAFTIIQTNDLDRADRIMKENGFGSLDLAEINLA